ncbi:glycosyltransferase family 4 protein [Tetragenococcus halophilus]|nr:glycosyltransferase family 4 protein [Tetragenococcus halophilus]
MDTKKLDILFLTDNGIDTTGGEQESTKIIIEGIKEKYKVGLIQPGKVNNSDEKVSYFSMTDITRLKHLIKSPVQFFKYIVKTKNIINETNPTMIHTQSQVSFFIIALLKKIRMVSKDIHIIHTERGFYKGYNTFFKLLFFFFINELNVLVTTTHINMSLWKNSINRRNQKLEFQIIENTAGKIFETYDNTLEKNRSNDLVLGFAGRYTEQKDWPLAVEIVEKLNTNIGEKFSVKMAVGCLDEVSLQQTKKMFAHLENILGNRFDGKINITLQEMNQFYYDIDVFILTSKKNSESFGRTLVEAMSRKTIVLTTDAGGPVEVVDNRNNVCYSADEFVTKVRYLFENKKIMFEEKKKIYKR